MFLNDQETATDLLYYEAIAKTIVDELHRARPTSTRVAEAARKVLKRVDWLKLARKAGGFALTAVTGMPTLDQIEGLSDMAKAIVSKPQEHLSLKDLKSVGVLPLIHPYQ